MDLGAPYFQTNSNGVNEEIKFGDAGSTFGARICQYVYVNIWINMNQWCEPLWTNMIVRGAGPAQAQASTKGVAFGWAGNKWQADLIVTNICGCWGDMIWLIKIVGSSGYQLECLDIGETLDPWGVSWKPMVVVSKVLSKYLWTIEDTLACIGGALRCGRRAWIRFCQTVASGSKEHSEHKGRCTFKGHGPFAALSLLHLSLTFDNLKNKLAFQLH